MNLWAARVKALVKLADAFVGDGGVGGSAGIVPAPGAGDAAAGKFLKANGLWAIPTLGDSSLWIPIEFQQTLADATTFDFTAVLDGDVDYAYRIDWEIFAQAALNLSYNVRLNGAVWAGTRQIDTSTGTTMSTANDSAAVITTAGNVIGNKTSGYVEIDAKQGIRQARWQASATNGGALRMYAGVYQMTTPATNAKIVSAGMGSGTTDAIKAGSRFMLSKRKVL